MKHIPTLLVLLFFLASSCREKFVPQLKEQATGHLVVDGFINSGTGGTTISLSRTTALTNANIVRETKALVRVEGKTNTTGFPLTETPANSGIYTRPLLTLNPNDQYRVYIKTANGVEYYSEYSSVRRTPDIDSIAWRFEKEGVRLYGNTHNTQEPTGYYQWKFDETWEFHSTYMSNLKFNLIQGVPVSVGYRDSSTRGYDLSIFRCWQYDTSRSILVTSTARLTENRVSMFPLQLIESDTWKLSVRYSMNAKLYSVSREGHNFLEQLKKNTEQLGSIFDAQPSDNYGNIRCVTNPAEIVIGFVEVTEEKRKRIFIDWNDLPSWRYRQGCELPDSAANQPKDLLNRGAYLPTIIKALNPINNQVIDSVFISPIACVDCRLRGSNVKPSFW